MLVSLVSHLRKQLSTRDLAVSLSRAYLVFGLASQSLNSFGSRSGTLPHQHVAPAASFALANDAGRIPEDLWP